MGSHWENHYQKALSNCHELKLQNNEVRLRAVSQPDNTKDCNANKFEVLHDGEWQLMGYYGVKKILCFCRLRLLGRYNTTDDPQVYEYLEELACFLQGHLQIHDQIKFKSSLSLF